MLSYAVAFLVLVIAFFVARMSSVFSTSNIYLSEILVTMQGLRQDIEKLKTQVELSKPIDKIHEQLGQIALSTVELNGTSLRTQDHIRYDVQVIKDITLTCSYELMKINEQIEERFHRTD